MKTRRGKGDSRIRVEGTFSTAIPAATAVISLDRTSRIAWNNQAATGSNASPSVGHFFVRSSEKVIIGPAGNVSNICRNGLNGYAVFFTVSPWFSWICTGQFVSLKHWFTLVLAHNYETNRHVALVKIESSSYGHFGAPLRAQRSDSDAWRMSAFCSRRAIRLELVPMTAIDPKWPFATRPIACGSIASLTVKEKELGSEGGT